MVKTFNQRTTLSEKAILAGSRMILQAVTIYCDSRKENHVYEVGATVEGPHGIGVIEEIAASATLKIEGVGAHAVGFLSVLYRYEVEPGPHFKTATQHSRHSIDEFLPFNQIL